MSKVVTAQSALTANAPLWWRYWKLAKYRVDIHLGLAIAWSLAPMSMAFTPRTLLLVSLSFVFLATICCAAIVFDDVNGYRDGSDAKNYPSQNVTGYRPRVKKPLVAGLLTDTQAVRFGVLLVVTSFTFVVLAWFAAGREPWWLLPSLLAAAVFSAQYSYGLKLSYIGAQDLVLFLSFFGTVVLPHALITGETTAASLIAGAVLGLWDVQVVQFSNIPDAPADREVGRRTMAVLLSRRSHARLIGGTAVVIWGLSIAGVALRWLPAVAVVTWLPAIGLHVTTLRAGFHPQPERAYRGRILGWYTMRAWALGLAAANVLTARVGG
jgi:1,4-dihydroxy-2-naphthoate octaprenyltransferase